MNARQKKKQFKHKILSMKPDDWLAIEFDIDKIDLDAAADYAFTLGETFNDRVNWILLPSMTATVYDKETIIQFLENTLNKIKNAGD